MRTKFEQLSLEEVHKEWLWTLSYTQYLCDTCYRVKAIYFYRCSDSNPYSYPAWYCSEECLNINILGEIFEA